MSTTAPCVRLQWDSEWWRCEVVRVVAPSSAPEKIVALEKWCADHHVDMAMVLISSDEVTTLEVFVAAGFQRVDNRVTLVASASTMPVFRPTVVIRKAEFGDIAELRDIASRNHRGSRFYEDPHFPNERCDEFYAEWIENDVRGRADVVFVAHEEQHIVGYLSLRRQEDSTDATISLVGVDPARQRRGIASALFAHMGQWCAHVGVTRVVVATQATNDPALSFYQSHGFSIRASEHWLHRWWLPD